MLVCVVLLRAVCVVCMAVSCGRCVSCACRGCVCASLSCCVCVRYVGTAAGMDFWIFFGVSARGRRTGGRADGFSGRRNYLPYTTSL